MGDHFTVLGLTPGATADDVQRAYRRLALQHHPDRNPGDPAAADRFRAVQAAYDALKNHSPRPQARPQPPSRPPRPQPAGRRGRFWEVIYEAEEGDSRPHPVVRPVRTFAPPPTPWFRDVYAPYYTTDGMPDLRGGKG